MRAIVAAFSLSLVATAPAQTLSDASLLRTDYLTGLSSPTGIRFFGPNEGFVIEKGGTVKYFANGSVSTALSLTVASNNERGLLGIALDPAFAANGHVYLYHSNGSGSTNATAAWIDNRVTRYTWDAVTKTLGNPDLARTFGTAVNGSPDGANHNGGVLAFGADGKLYGVTGDLNRDAVEQNNRASSSSAYSGGVFRLDSDLSVPADVHNKFTGDFAPWYAYGVRNSFGLAVDPVTGHLWNTENGESTFDEINLVTAGMNSGWRPIQGPAGAQDPAAVLNMLPGATYQDPKFSFASAIGITSIQFLHGSSWGDAYDDAVLIGENNSGRLWLFRLNAARDGFALEGALADKVFNSGDGMTAFGTGFMVTTDIQVGPDGAVYVASLGAGEIYRIAPVPEPSQWMLASAGLGVVWLAVRRRKRRPTA